MLFFYILFPVSPCRTITRSTMRRRAAASSTWVFFGPTTGETLLGEGPGKTHGNMAIWGVPEVGRSPKCLVSFVEKFHRSKRMITRGSPIFFGNL